MTKIEIQKQTLDLATLLDDREANLFARLLLVPTAFLAAEIKKRKITHFSDKDMKALAKVFRVEQSVLMLRLVEEKFFCSKSKHIRLSREGRLWQTRKDRFNLAKRLWAVKPRMSGKRCQKTKKIVGFV